MNPPKISLIDRLLSVWIFLSMAIGIILSIEIPSAAQILHHFSIATTSIPIAIGLIVMMYPPLAKVEFNKLVYSFSQTKVISLSLIFNWIIGPLLMFCLSFIFLHNKPMYMMGLILVGLARCIAMVILWNDLANGNRSLCAALVAINAVFQMIAFSLYAYFFLNLVLPWLGFHGAAVHFSIINTAKNVLTYLGIPFILGVGGRLLLVKLKGEAWYNEKYLPAISPAALIALLYTIVLLFTVQGADLIKLPLDVLHIAIPLIIYFIAMFYLTYVISKKMHVDRASCTTLAFTSASNNFELAIAISIAAFGIHSAVSLAAVVGPLIEVPVMLLFVKIINSKA